MVDVSQDWGWPRCRRGIYTGCIRVPKSFKRYFIFVCGISCGC
jgi:hypothetical protein